MRAAALGALSLGGEAVALLASGCARQPKNALSLNQRLMHVRFSVKGTLASTTSLPFYYFCVINLTDNPTDPGPVPIVTAPANGVSVPPAGTETDTTQTFVGFIQYDTGSQIYTLSRCPVLGSGTSAYFKPAVQVLSYSEFEPYGYPDQSVLPGNEGDNLANTFDATLDLTRLKPDPSDPLPRYAQVNFITYNYLASGAGFGPLHYWDGIGSGARTTNDYVVLDTTTTQSFSSANFTQAPQGDVQDQHGNTVALTSDPAIPNLYITTWSIAIL